MEIELHSIDPSRLRQAESGQFIVRFLDDFQNLGLDANQDLIFKSMFDNLTQQSAEYRKAIKRVRAKEESPELKLLDTRRYQKVITLKRAYRVFEYTDAVPEREAFLLLGPVFSKYKNIGRINFEAKSYNIEILVKQLRKAKYLPAVQLLLLEGHVNTMKAANDAFDVLFSIRSVSIANTPVYDSAAMRKAIYETYKALADYVLVMARQAGSAYHTEIFGILNQTRIYYSDLIAKRKGSSKARKKRGEE